MIGIIDCETESLDCRRFVLGCFYRGQKKIEFFTNKDDMWKRLIEIGEEEQKKKRVLTLYGHQMEYDFYCIANLEDKHIKYYCLRPFIAKYEVNGKTIIKFLDSLGIFKMSLKELGDIIGKPKLEIPKKYIEGIRNQVIIEEDKIYNARDCEIIYDSIKMLKEKIKKEGVKLKGIYTTSQIAINYFMNKLREDEKNNDLFIDERKIELIKTRYKGHIHQAYRGGRVECFKTGTFENVNYIDNNNLYGYASMNIKFPDLKTEKFEYNPLRNKNLNEILNEIGICRCLIYNKSNKLRLLPIRTDVGNYYPRENKYLLGTWTTIELKEAVEEGYEILEMEWCITWKEHSNPYIKITNELYNLRLNAQNSFEKLFYKEMQNFSYGKLAQNRDTWELIIDSVELAKKYISEDWKAIKGIGKENYMYEKNIKCRERNYYCPIIPTLINAWARVYMYKQMKKFSYEQLLYHDTDSIMFQEGIPENIRINKEIGMFKQLNKNDKAIIYGRKTYRIGNEIKVSGFKNKNTTFKQFTEGKIENMRMETLKTTKDLRRVGGFKKEKRDLKEDNKKYKKMTGILSEGKVFKDNSLKNINYFMESLEKIR